MAEVQQQEETQAPLKVLIAMDKSKHAEFAIKYYLETLHRPSNEVILFHLVDDIAPSTMYMGGGASTIIWEENAARLKKESLETQQELKERMEANQLHGEVAVRAGFHAGEEIVATADETGATMIVMGSRGMGLLRRTILGSVSDYVLHHAHCPVIIAKME